MSTELPRVYLDYIPCLLRDWCLNRQLILTEVDLRWGVPAESTSETILR